MKNKLRMRNKFFPVGIIVFLMLFIIACGGGGGDSAPPTYNISGAVSGDTLYGVTINLTGAATTSATTDASGNFSITGLANGAYTVTPVKAGYIFTPSSSAVTVSGANITGTNFVAATIIYDHTYSISGAVSGDVLSGVTITLSGAGSATTTTNASGNYSFSGLADGSYTVTPSLAGYTFSPASRSVTINNVNSTGNNFTTTQVSRLAPLPPWLTYCDTEPCTSIAPVVVYVCPAGSPQCTPARSTTIIPQVDGKPISGVFFPLVAPDDTSLRLVSGNGNVVSFLVWAFQASKVILGSDQDVLVSYYNVAPVWGGTTPLNFTSTLLTSALLDTVFYYHPSYDTGTAATDLHAQGQAVIMTERAMTGLTSEHVTAFFMPTELVAEQYGEGNFSYGNGTVTINYGNPPHIVAKGGIMNTALPRFAHEYVHELFNKIKTAFSGNGGCLNEGIADALAYAAGFLPEEEFGPVGLRGIDFDSGCNALSEIHDVGNCYFWHVKKAGLLTPSFLSGIFHPQHTFSFDSCAQNTIETGNSILVYFTESAGGANMVPVLESMKIPHAGSYDAAKQALGL